MYQLYALVPALAVPKIKTQLNNINLFAVSRDVFTLFSEWRSLLGVHQEQFDTIVWEAWMPAFRIAFGYYLITCDIKELYFDNGVLQLTILITLYRTWNVKDADTMLNLVETWKPILPGWIYQNILEQMVLPKINEGVESWDPLSDNIPIHAWIHPWLPILGRKTKDI